MKNFREYMFEALNHHQQAYVDQITHGDHTDAFVDTDFSDHVFGGPSSGLGRHDDKDVKIIPFHGAEELANTVPSSIQEHLDATGYKVHDWSKGLVVRKNIPEGNKPRPIGLGKVLNSTKAVSPETHYYADKAWQNHSIMKPHLEKGLEIMITRHPYHVAEQSTNKGWRSCMSLGSCPDMNQGFIGDEEMHKEIQNKEERANEQARRLGRANQAQGQFFYRVGGDIRGGAHMAYLIHKGDYNLKSPIARISMKPFHSEDIHDKYHKVTNQALERKTITQLHPAKMAELSWDKIKPEQTILRPVGQTYKTQEFKAGHPMITTFEREISDFSEKQFPMKQHIFKYHLDPRVQRDHGENELRINDNFRSKYYK